MSDAGVQGGAGSKGPTGAAAAASGVPEAIREFGPYTLLQELGRGAQGVVYLAEDTRLHRKVALKMLAGAAAQSAAVRDRFQREAEITSKLNHPGICGIHEVGAVQDIPYIAMQYLRGTTLAEIVHRAQTDVEAGGGPSEPRDKAASTSLTGKDAMQDVLVLIERTARALHAAHEAGLVHRDIKPGNIMVAPDGHPVLLDFGLARDLEDQGHTITETGQIMGTPAYMAPEQLRALRDAIDRRTDVYALGVTLYECLTLRRPFEAQAFEQLYSQILQGVPTNPRRLNPRIPPDLRTVLEVAMEREQSRRYATALDFAEDLRRVRSFEPIRAKAAGPILRARKWARRKPAQAVGVVAVVVFVVCGAVFLVGHGIARRREAREHLTFAESELASGNFGTALESVALSREKDPASTRALELKARIESERDRAELEARKQADFRAAASAREESAREQEDHAQVRARIVALRRELDQEHGQVMDGYAPSQARAAFALRERELGALRLKAESLLQDARESLEQAARLEAPWERTKATEAAFASFFLGRWREAVEEDDAPRVALFRAAVESHDQGGAHAGELLGRASMTVSVEPPEAEIYLFRYESYETVRPGDPIPRLVPTPTAGIGRSRDGAWTTDFFPGDTALSITQVDVGSPAEAAGLRPGDLVIRLDGQPAGDGLFVASEPPGGPLAEAGVKPPVRVATLNGVPITGRLDWSTAAGAADGSPDRVKFHGRDGEVVCDRKDVVLGRPQDLIAQGSPDVSFAILCLHDGNPVVLQVPKGRGAGIRCEPTAYPLICNVANRVSTARVIEIDPGSYLLFVGRSGYEDQRLPVVVPRLGTVEPHVTLLRSGATPPGFVFIPPGRFVYGGDPGAEEAAPAREVELPGFFIGRREVTNAEWAEFVDDPETQQRIQGSSSPIYVPREQDSSLIPKANLGGPTTPVMGISWNEVRDYLAWRNRKARQAGEPWIFNLPTEKEWEKAARGVDARSFPWGNRFDFDVVVGLYSKPMGIFNAPGGFEPRDESPFGVQDAGGLRQEWTADPYVPDPAAPPFYRVRGGSWASPRESLFRSASRFWQDASVGGGRKGFRLVARLEGGGAGAAAPRDR